MSPEKTKSTIGHRTSYTYKTKYETQPLYNESSRNERFMFEIECSLKTL